MAAAVVVLPVLDQQVMGPMVVATGQLTIQLVVPVQRILAAVVGLAVMQVGPEALAVLVVLALLLSRLWCKENNGYQQTLNRSRLQHSLPHRWSDYHRHRYR